MSKTNTDSLSRAARECYIRKLQCLYGVVGELRDEKCTRDHTLYKAMAALTTNMADITAVNGLNGHTLSRLYCTRTGQSESDCPCKDANE